MNIGDANIGLISLAAVVVAILLKVPVGIALLTTSYLGLWCLSGWSVAWGTLGIIPYNFAASWILSSLPMFLLLGFICQHMQLSNELLKLATILLSRIPGGLAIAAVLGASAFASICGSSIACSATIGRVAVPVMLDAKYDAQLAAGTVAVAGTVGALIPPSIILIIYSVFAQVSVTELFLGGLFAGVLTAIGYVVVILVRVRLQPHLAPAADTSFTARERVVATLSCWHLLLLGGVVLAGILGGFLTPTEAGAVSVALACVIAIYKRTFSVPRLIQSICEAAVTTSALIIIGIGASMLARLLSLSGASTLITDAVLALDADPLLFLLGLVIVYLVLGLFLDPIGSMLLTLPIVLPLVSDAGFGLVWFGVVLTKLLEIGMITPPVGMNVFVIKAVVGDRVETSSIFKGIVWFLLMDLAILLLLLGSPEIIFFLPFPLWSMNSLSIGSIG